MKLLIDIPDEMYEQIKDGYVPLGISKYLKNGSPLEKIKAEIEQNAYPIVHGVNDHEKGMTLYGILQIIDKYIGEKNEKHNDL